MRSRTFLNVSLGILTLAFAYQLGARAATAQAPSPSEVASLAGVLSHGQTIPLPTFADGTTALESECTWIVSPHLVRARLSTSGFIKVLECATDGRQVRITTCIQDDCLEGPTPGEANYMIVAVRGGQPTVQPGTSFGALKVRYRGEREPQGATSSTGR